MQSFTTSPKSWLLAQTKTKKDWPTYFWARKVDILINNFGGWRGRRKSKWGAIPIVFLFLPHQTLIWEVVNFCLTRLRKSNIEPQYIIYLFCIIDRLWKLYIFYLFLICTLKDAHMVDNWTYLAENVFKGWTPWSFPSLSLREFILPFEEV